MAARVGVVVRTKSRPYFLARAMRDISRQSMNDWDVVVVDDGDDLAGVTAVVRASSIADRVRVIGVPSPGGRCAAANAGVREAGNELIVLHDDDDLWEPDFLAETVGWLDAHVDDVGVVAATAIVYEEWRGDQWVEVRRAPFWAGMSRLSLGEMVAVNRAVPISFIYRSALHDVVGGYDEQLGAVEDWEFLLRVMPEHRIGFLAGSPLALWTQRPTARGADGNSMYELDAEHRRDDAVVRDRELAQWSRTNGLGIPLYIAEVERRLTDRLESEMRQQREWMAAELESQRPLLRRVREMRRRLRRP